MVKVNINHPVVKNLVNISLAIYLVILCWILFLGMGTFERSTHFQNPNDHFVPLQSTYSMVKNARFYDFRGNPMVVLILNVMGNLILLAPWGILAPLVFNKLKNFKSLAVSALLISFSAECIQFIFSIGIFDIDDLLFNTAGALIGFLGLQLGLRYLNLPEAVGARHLS